MKAALVLQTDFGLNDGAVSTMYGVARQVDPEVTVADLTHGITPFNIFEGSFRLSQTAKYWPAGTVFVSVVDPGVGSKRLSLVAKLKTGHYVVTPDNGTLTHLDKLYGIEAVRVIDESIDRLPGSEKSATFHGRDIYVYNGARLAGGQITFEEIGKELPVADIERLALNPARIEGNKIVGNVDITDVNFGSLWTNIEQTRWEEDFGSRYGDVFNVSVFYEGKRVYQAKLPYYKTFADVKNGETLIYMNSVYTVGIAIRMGSMAAENHLSAGQNWTIEIEKDN
ncbi:S-adenosyl-l-methionine hydroxide adenosyltransferase family protein [Fructobacillus sp. CRL 2054]|uniref:SAM hydrolase/SAM-dependent halogenase family protein n=1 Tax=Fructobacillus sp. CRL 2054 TaxID=2763007 RepID=UPI0023789E85|nr:S-adenosyl-l-methionine hydroxide adenosyltransferase family protein [Fructobacillus sp. CRL 2054]MDD9138071.1 S-adenosyl-l-methionine hydroxide adenosyltransferase family protein [Fructobacillus sp. CRL 2054]